MVHNHCVVSALFACLFTHTHTYQSERARAILKTWRFTQIDSESSRWWQCGLGCSLWVSGTLTRTSGLHSQDCTVKGWGSISTIWNWALHLRSPALITKPHLHLFRDLANGGPGRWAPEAGCWNPQFHTCHQCLHIQLQIFSHSWQLN